MEDCYPVERTCPKLEANCFSRIFFAWMRRIYKEGSTEGLHFKNLYKTQDCNKSSKLTNRLEKIWKSEIERGKLENIKPSLLQVIFKVFSLKYFAWGLLIFINVVMIRVGGITWAVSWCPTYIFNYIIGYQNIRFRDNKKQHKEPNIIASRNPGSIQPLILSNLIKLFSADRYTLKQVLFHGATLSSLTIASAFLNHHAICSMNLIGMRMRIAVSSLMYRKILKLSQLSLRTTTAGQVVNLLSNDVARFDLVVLGLNYLWIAPIQVLIVGYFMWIKIGLSSLAGLMIILVISIPLQFVLGSATSKYRKKVAERTDSRIKIMSEILSSIQTIKMYAWEKPFEHFIKNAREDEMKYVTKTSYIKGILTSCMIFTDRITLAITIICYVILGNELRADLVFSLSMYFNILQLTFGNTFPRIISIGAETLVSIKRIQDFLLLDERKLFETIKSKTSAVTVQNVEASWLCGSPILKDFNVTLAPGDLCAVIGSVGSGKSSFLKLLLGELNASRGQVEHSCNISYSSQEPWLFSSTVKNNILFGNKFDGERYRKVVEVCALEKDFKIFPEGDNTRAGDKGVTLSGGQKARINLARAVYKESDVYLFDDPLSAVDPAVGRHLYNECISNFLTGKTRILVTHRLQFAKKADIIIVLNKGSIEAKGTFEELLQRGLDFTNLLDLTDEVHQTECNIVKSENTAVDQPSLPLAGKKADINPHKMSDSDIFHDNCEYKGSAFWAYVKSSGRFSAVATLVLLFLTQILLSGADYWITLWTTQGELRLRSKNFNRTSHSNLSHVIHQSKKEIPSQNTIATSPISSFFQEIDNAVTDHVIKDGQEYVLLKETILMYIYAFIVVAALVVTLSRSTVFFYSCMQASRKLHNNMFLCLLQAPMRFFNINPSGTILNRFSKDIGSVDELLPKALLDVLQILLTLVGILLMVIFTNPYLIFVVVILGLLFIQVRKWYFSTVRAIKHIEGVAKSPVFSFVSSSIEGVTTIRAAKNEDILKKQFDDYQDVHSSAWYLTVLCSASFGLWLDLICAVFVCLVISGFVLLDQFIDVPGSYVGLGVSQSYILIGMLQYGARQLGDIVNFLTGVERILDYTQLEKEQTFATSKDIEIKEPWPSRGNIVFQNLYLKYIPSNPPILKNLNLEISPAERIGIVGRTGAGKSSLIAALFRLAFIEGKILIDDVNIGTLELKNLRKKISIIPQEPVLFSSTIRYNLDPLNECKDDELWNALEEVKLRDEISSLDSTVAEGGKNFSVGQKQLICLARVILKNNKILILDEATANVDPKTDEFIQNTIRRKFEACTVLTVAHRLNTIMDSDKIVVMDNGYIVEFDHPFVLLQNKKGFFTKMLQEMGPTSAKSLERIAYETFQSKTPLTHL